MRLLFAAAVAALVATALPSSAKAHCYGCGVAAGVVAGTIIGSAIAAPPPPPPPVVVYDDPPPPPYAAPPPDDYADGPACHTEQEQVWDGRAWRMRNYQVCD